MAIQPPYLQQFEFGMKRISFFSFLVVSSLETTYRKHEFMKLSTLDKEFQNNHYQLVYDTVRYLSICCEFVEVRILLLTTSPLTCTQYTSFIQYTIKEILRLLPSFTFVFLHSTYEKIAFLTPVCIMYPHMELKVLEIKSSQKTEIVQKLSYQA